MFRKEQLEDETGCNGLFYRYSKGSKGLKKSQMMASDASHMLEAALEQMDDIIAGTKSATEYANGGYDIVSPAPSVYLGTFQILHLLEDLKMALEMLEDPQEKEALRNQIPGATAVCLREWFEENLAQVNHHSSNNETYQERLARLEGDKESLILQVSVLTDQVEAQGEKIRDLEICLEGHQLKLNATEEMLQQELLSRTSLETQKLDLMAEVSDLKIKLVGMEKEQSEYEEKQSKAEAEIAQLQEQLALKDAEIERLQSQLSRTSSHSEVAEREEVYRRRLKEKHQEVQRLKIGMESLLAANEEKDRRIEELTLLLSQYRRVKEIMIAAHGKMSCSSISGGSEEELETTLRKWNLLNNPQGEIFKTEASSGEMSPAVLSPVPHKAMEIRVPQKKKSSSLEDLQSEALEKYVDGKPVQPVVEQESKPLAKGSKYQTLPGKLPRPLQNGEQGTYNSPDGSGMNDNEDNSILGLRETENMDGTVVSDDLSPISSGTDSGPQSPLSPESRKSPKGIKKIWGKIRRTQSGNFPADDLGLAEFRRGGLRATAGPRLARSKETKGQKSDHNAPFAQWSTERVCNWLEDFGLGQYVIFARQWVTSGHTLLTATPQDMEKEMGIKHPLHRKKLVLAIKSINAKQDEKSAQLDHIWVTRWLDDIGLPQYKDQFHESRVDGRMLQYLTVNDLLFLKVTSQLHHLSIKCAIHVLHVNGFNPHCLRRRPVEENNVSPSEVVQWSNHRVMEWLRSVDLAEYAPNLRGSGVHGGLIILEPRFNGDTLAMLLNIPPQKTLLRRHLTTNFNVLIGPEAQQEKREIMESTAYTPLTTTAKVRPKKLGFSHFGNLRKKKFDESTDYICPMDTNPAAANGTQKNYGGYKGLSPFTDRELDQMEHSEGTVMQIGALSQGISHLTTMLSQDEMLNDSRFLTPTFEDWR
ncbi:liprin-beta-2 isoform x7 [Limosa lapponica baueri]|uniref:Liprin-beta-2 isoform x7 n=1 Tax=Limosa lapponica baueri TaxID=1758121 RepID=A0A2I0UNS8_LIMLA|nr:liprin-beta-2 isoform x7 [Limosa lapponica baueri]